MGYNAKDYVNVQAGPKDKGSIMRTLGDAIFTVFGHANKGRVVCFDNNNKLTRIAANGTSPSNNYSLEYNYENTTNKLKKMRFAHYAGCHTYGTDSTYGNLTTKSYNCLVDVVVTHRDYFYATPGTYFSYLIFYYGRTQSSSTTIKSNVESAVSYALSYYGNNAQAIETLNVHIGGRDTSSKFKPASYGS